MLTTVSTLTGVLLGAVIVLIREFVRLRERVAKIEEWKNSVQRREW